MKRLVITGGAGFVGGNLAVALKQAMPQTEILAVDNLHRRGSEYQLSRLMENGVSFQRGDVRIMDDLLALPAFDFLIECSAEPSVLAGTNSSPDYLVRTNLQGATNCAELCRRHGAGLLFLSTSRVYPILSLCQLAIETVPTRYELAAEQPLPGVTIRGVGEAFSLEGSRSLYGATKLSAELVLREYREAFDLPVVINRCGVIAGPWQFGRADQGVVAYWVGAHLFNKPLSYIGFDGTGRQVRDAVHVEDLARLVLMQLHSPQSFADGVYNVGGGREVSFSLQELTALCAEVTGNSLEVGIRLEERYADIPIYLSDCTKLEGICDWRPKKTMSDIVEETCRWMRETPQVKGLFG
jgi:CDP-paratose 2-epimerase